METYGSMEKLEKIEYILYQMELMLLAGDYVRLYIISQKLESKFMAGSAFNDCRVKFYSMMLKYYENDKKYFNCYNCLREMYETLKNKNNGQISADMLNVFINAMLYLMISHNNVDKK